jgi:hypothetical protein
MQDRQRESNKLNLDARATAYVEVRGEPGIQQLVQSYLIDPGRSREELRAVVRALSIHATHAPALRESVVAAYRRLLETHPGAAPDIIRDLMAWQRWDLTDHMLALQP